MAFGIFRFGVFLPLILFSLIPYPDFFMKKILFLIPLVSGLHFNVKSMHSFSVLTVRKISMSYSQRINMIDDQLNVNAGKWSNLKFSLEDQACSFLFIVNRMTVVMIKEVPSQS